MLPSVALSLALIAAPAAFVSTSVDHAAAKTLPSVDPIAADSTRVVPNDNRTPAGKLRDGVLSLRLTARVALWRPEGSRGAEVPVYAFAEEGRAPLVPGPLIRVPAGTELRLTLRNSLPQELQVFGVQDLPAASPDTITLLPGELKDLRVRLSEPGTYLYWGRTERDTFRFGRLADGVLTGAIVVDPAPAAGAAARSADDRIFVMNLWQARPVTPGTEVEQREEVMVINGLSWPHTERLQFTVGDTVRWRVINASRRVHPMHLHGFYYQVDARGTGLRDTAYAPPARRMVVTEPMLVGSTMAMTFSPHTPGNWLFHCHVVGHISARLNPHAPVVAGPPMAAHGNHAMDGMTGLVLGIVVKPKAGQRPAPDEPPRRALRLVATERPNVFRDQPAYSFVLQEGSREPADDSLRSPGSAIVLTRGEPVAITVVNRARSPVTVHWHGIELESYIDGVGGWSGAADRVAPSIAPRDSFVVRFNPRRAGTFIYHTHFDEPRQLGAGLYGPLIVTEPGVPRDTVADRIFLMGSGGPFADSPPSLNGATDPEPIELEAGRTYRLRFISIAANDGKRLRLLADTVLLHWRAVAKDGADLPRHQATMRPARVAMGPGETWDFEYTPERPGESTLEITTIGRVGLPPVVSRIPVRVRAGG